MIKTYLAHDMCIEFFQDRTIHTYNCFEGDIVMEFVLSLEQPCKNSRRKIHDFQCLMIFGENCADKARVISMTIKRDYTIDIEIDWK